MLNRRHDIRLMIAACFAVITYILAPGTEASQQNIFELTLPREPAQDEAVWLQIQVGSLAHGALITVTSTDGALLGSVSPYGPTRGATSATYLVPLPKTAVVNRRIKVRLTIDEPGKPGRAPRTDEVQNIAPVYVPVTH